MSIMYPQNKPGDIINIAVYDCFEGKVRLLLQRKNAVYIEIIDVCMCYSCQVQSQTGEKYWIRKNDIFQYREENN